MIEHFPLSATARIFTNEDFQHHTRNVDVASLSFAERAAAHYTTLLQDRTIQRNNARNGYFFCVCIYDALVAAGIAAERISFNMRASKNHHDDIDIRIAPCVPTKGAMCLYLKTSLRERWKQVDRDARIAKEIWGNRTRTVCLVYAEHGVKGFRQDCAHPEKLASKFIRMEEWAYGVDTYAALSQTTKVNSLLPYLLGEFPYVNGVTRHEC